MPNTPRVDMTETFFFFWINKKHKTMIPHKVNEITFCGLRGIVQK